MMSDKEILEAIIRIATHKDISTRDKVDAIAKLVE
jgi:hypothetical protein